MRLVGVAVLVAGLAIGCATAPSTGDGATVPATAQSAFDPSAPTDIWLGRGSGMFGLDVVHLSRHGELFVDRAVAAPASSPPGLPGYVHERAHLRVAASVTADARDLVRRLRVDRLRAEYRKKGMHDGTQWVLRVRQDGYDRSVVFDNRFPRAVRRFARDLDVLTGAQGVAEAFAPLDAEAWSRTEQALWASLDD